MFTQKSDFLWQIQKKKYNDLYHYQTYYTKKKNE